MIKELLEEKIQEALKSDDKLLLKVVRMVKNEFQKQEKNKVEVTPEIETRVIVKMIDQRRESAKIYRENGRETLAEIEEAEIEVLNQWAPKLPTPEKLETELIPGLMKELGHKPEMKDLKGIIASLQSRYPGLDNKLVSSIYRRLCS